MEGEAMIPSKAACKWAATVVLLEANNSLERGSIGTEDVAAIQEVAAYLRSLHTERTCGRHEEKVMNNKQITSRRTGEVKC
jgi:hypothetical protein